MLDPQTLLDSTFFLIPSFMPRKGLDPQVSMRAQIMTRQWLTPGSMKTMPTGQFHKV